MINFNAIDVETANADRASICQIGIVRVIEGQIVDQWKSLVNPEDWFDPWNVRVHKIEESDVKNSPTIPELREELRTRLRGSILVSHTNFDQVAFERSMKKYKLEQLQVYWLDSAKIARRAWPEQYGSRGYGLKNLAKDFGIEFLHHNALEDARATAEIVLRACADTGIGIEDWLSMLGNTNLPKSSHSSVSSSQNTSRTNFGKTKRYVRWEKSVSMIGNVDGPLFGETVLFSGRLSRSRIEASEMAAKSGCDVVTGASRKVTILVLGVQDKDRLNGYKKSSKHRRVESLISKGFEIQILSEDDFLDLMVTKS